MTKFYQGYNAITLVIKSLSSKDDILLANQGKLWLDKTYIHHYLTNFNDTTNGGYGIFRLNK